MRAILCLFVLTCATTVAADANDDAAVRNALAKLFPNQPDATLHDTPLPGMREVVVGTQVLYMSHDGRYVLAGPLVDSETGENLTERRVASARADLLRDSEQVQRYRWAGEGNARTITVVTDIDCPYCRRLHKDIPKYNAAGIAVEYVMLPRSGKDTPSYFKTVGAACATQPEDAITAAMNGEKTVEQSCENPIDEHMALARALGVTSTPTIVLDDGRMVLGQKSPEALLTMMEEGS